ncbi:MAG: MFS transporter [Pseudomonadota bacterium]
MTSTASTTLETPGFARFIAANARWLGAGFLLTASSSFGQTWFISLFAGEIQAKHALSDGAWGSLYTVATLASATLLFWRGDWADRVPFAALVAVISMAFASALVLFAFAPTVWLLGVALFGLRFCGQGMFTHIAMTAMGRWFAAHRGRAVAITNLGHPLSEIILPPTVVLAIATVGWQPTLAFSAFLLAIPIALALRRLLSGSRTPKSVEENMDTPGLFGRHWTRADARRHWLLPALVPVLLTPGFIGTVIFFHQVHIADQKGWTLLAMTPGYASFAGLAILFSILSGLASDRFGPHRLLPFLLLPMGLGIALLGPASDIWHWYAALGLLGISQGISNALAGVLYPFVYGTRHLGSIRSMATTIMIFSTAIGPGITGILIDRGIPFAAQAPFMGAWCFVFSLLCLWISVRLNKQIGVQAA